MSELNKQILSYVGSEFFSKSVVPFLSAIVGAGCMMFYNYIATKTENKRKTTNDMYSVVTQLGGFINYFQFACHMNSALRSEDYQRIIDKIFKVNKDIFDSSHSFFYNSQFKEKVQHDLSRFLEVYIGWKGYRPLMLPEVFDEYIEINNMQLLAIDCLNKIIEEYSEDTKLVCFVENVVSSKDAIEKRCKDLNQKMEFVTHNLHYIFYLADFSDIVAQWFNGREIDDDEIRKKIVCQLFKHFHAQKIFQLTDNAFGQALVNEKIKGIDIIHKEIITGSDDAERRFSYEDVGTLIFRVYMAG